MKYGYFDKQAKEYVITRPDTPTPWINYLGSGNFGGIISNTGGGFSFHKDPQNRRVTRYRYNGIPMDRPGRYIYIRDKISGEYWNPGFQPVQKKLDSYSCRHGLGYTILEGEYKGVNTSVTYFVPEDKDFEVWLVKVRNSTSTHKNLQVFSYAEFCFPDAVMDQQNADWVQQINQGRCEKDIITWYPHHSSSSASFFASGEKASSFDTNLETFIGKYRSETDPIAVEQGECSNSMSYRTNGVGAFCIDAELSGKEEKEFVFILGYSEQKNTIGKEIGEYLSPVKARASLGKLRNYWDRYIGKLHVETPDEDMNLFVNIWNQYQCKTTFNWSRFVSLYQWGLGRGMGFRDSSQDILGVLHTIPEEAKKLIIKLLKCQYTDGRAYHLFFPLTGEGGIGDAPVKKFDWYSDDHLWIILSITAYVKETGDFSFLEAMIPYNDKLTEGSVFEHLDKALHFTNSNKGPHNIALAGRADWNDTLNLDQGKGIAESVFTSMFYCKALQEMIGLCEFLGKIDHAQKYKVMYKEMKEAINKNCWDGEWYIRAFDDESNSLGSKENEKGKIFINSQSWAVLSNVATPEFAEKSLSSLERYLNTEYGVAAMYPAYTEYDDSKGGITTYPPGAKENGGVFVHTNPWVMIAETLMGHGDKAFKYYKQVMPARHNNNADHFEVEPYVYPQNILGKEHPQFGIARNSWLSGAAAWNMVASSQHILGIRPDYDSLVIDPCIPSDWNGFRAKRVFRGVIYNIEVQNPNGVQKGISKISVDGTVVDKVPLFEAGTVHSVTVIMGR